MNLVLTAGLTVTSLLGIEGPRSSPATPCKLTKVVPCDTASTQALGNAVTVHGNIMVLGSEQDDSTNPSNIATNCGAVYVFRRDNRAWVLEQKLVRSSEVSALRFGSAVATDGLRILAAAHTDIADPAPKPAWIYRRDGTTWIEEAELSPDGLVLEDQFGASVSIDGDTAVVGAHGGNLVFPGKVYVFRRSGTSWDSVPQVLTDPIEGEQFGYSVSVSGDHIVVGSKTTGARLPNGGAAYVYRRNAETGVWEQEGPIIKAAEIGEYFGASVSIDHDRMVVGAPFYGGSNIGAAYVYRHSENGTPNPADDSWSLEQILYPTHGAVQTEFGTSVAISDRRLVVGASPHDHSSTHDGAAYVFERNASGQWVTSGEMTLALEEVPQRDDGFGSGVAISGELVVLGRPGASGTMPPTDNAGAVYLYDASGAQCQDRLELTSLSWIAPTQGPESGGNCVIIAGNGFTSGMTASFGGVPALSTIFVSPTLLLVVVPPLPRALAAANPRTMIAAHTPVDVTVVGSCGSGTMPAAYRYSKSSVGPPSLK